MTGKDYTTSLPFETVEACFLRDYFDLLLLLISACLYCLYVKQISRSQLPSFLSVHPPKWTAGFLKLYMPEAVKTALW